MKSRRGQSASGSAVLLAIVAALIVVYIMFLPPAERADLLGDEPSGGGGGVVVPPEGGLQQPIVLLREPIGTVYYQRTATADHDIAPVKVFSQTGAFEIKSVDSIHVRRTVFDETSQHVTFTIDPDMSSNLVLTFNVIKASGSLMVSLNGNVIANTQYAAGSIKPIRLDSDLLLKTNNISFSVSGPGGAFWQTNEYQLENILVAGDITDVSRTFSEQHFAIPTAEFDLLQTSTLYFRPLCDVRQGAPLFITLNFDTVYSTVPSCNAVNKVEVAISKLGPDDNVISFSTPFGSFSIDQIKVQTRLERPLDPTLYFELPPDLYSLTRFRKANAVLVLNFADDEVLKRGVVSVNGRKANLNQKAGTFVYDVTQYVREGTNAVVISAAGQDLQVTELLVELR
ncbi:MAG: hypothetical protein ABIH41_03955 [Nanoarchaeota archaeon]